MTYNKNAIFPTQNCTLSDVSLTQIIANVALKPEQKCSVLLKKPCDAHLNNTICAMCEYLIDQGGKLSGLECCYVIDWTH